VRSVTGTQQKRKESDMGYLLLGFALLATAMIYPCLIVSGRRARHEETVEFVKRTEDGW
jgi:hypothetical protein